MRKTIVFATGNKHKLSEAAEIFKDFEVLSIKEFVSDFDPEEYGRTFLENAVIKAQEALKSVKKYPVLSDDSGLVVPALNGAPGIYSARFAGEGADDAANREKLSVQLDGKDDRAAYFACCAVLLFPDYTLLSTEGRCEGNIALSEAGDNGFGYDPLFVPQSSELTMAQLSSDQKHAISHRGRAFRSLEELVRCIHV